MYIQLCDLTADVCVRRCVSVPPAQPENAEVTEDTPTTVVIEVTPSDNDGGVPIIGYTVLGG